jgi:hypothetical protein
MAFFHGVSLRGNLLPSAPDLPILGEAVRSANYFAVLRFGGVRSGGGLAPPE